jgi:hypothetical protein
VLQDGDGRVPVQLAGYASTAAPVLPRHARFNTEATLFIGLHLAFLNLCLTTTMIF